MERASRRKYHYIYKTTCTITNKFYIGMHSTDNLKDGYIGSGKRLWYSINKYGKDNHVCEILEFLTDRKSLKEREKEIVNTELINEDLCMNIQLGGGGGISSHDHYLNFTTAGKNNLKKSIESGDALRNRINRWNTDESFRNEYSRKLKDNAKNNKNWLGKKHSEETKRKIGETNSTKQKGSNNSQYGKCWITNETESRKIYKGDTIPEGWRLGRKM